MKRVANQARGFSIAAVLVVLVLLGVIAEVFIQSSKRVSQATRQLRLTGDLADIGSYVSKLIDCSQTIARLPVPCPAGFPVALYKGPVDTLLRVPGEDGSTVLGNWNLRASCTATPRTFLVEASNIAGENCKPGMHPPCWSNVLTPLLNCP